MISFREVRPDDPGAHALLGEYFAERQAGFPAAQGAYSVSFPDRDRFAGGALIVALLDEDEVGDEAGIEACSGKRGSLGVEVGIGGIRPLPTGEFEVKHLYLRPVTRGRGLGRALLAELEERAARLGATRMVLDSNDSLAAAAHLYRAAGYQPIPPYNDNPNATSWYGKPLPPRS